MVSAGHLPSVDSDETEQVFPLSCSESMPAAHFDDDDLGYEYSSYALFVVSGISENENLYAFTDLTGGGNRAPGYPVAMSGDNDFYVAASDDTAVNSQPEEIEMAVSLGAINKDENNSRNTISVKRYAYLLGKESVIIAG